MSYRTRRFITFEVVQRSEIGRHDDGSMDGLSGLSIGMILASFQMIGIVLWNHEWLQGWASVLIPILPRCLMQAYTCIYFSLLTNN